MLKRTCHVPGLIAGLTLLGVLSTAGWAQAPAAPASSADDASMEALKQRLRDQDRRISELESAMKDPAAYQQARKAEIERIVSEINADAAKAKAAAIPGWLDGLKIYGDLRLRYQSESFNWGATADSKKKDRNRARYRARIGLTKTWDEWEIGVRLASGNSNDPTSTNQTFGESGSSEPPYAKRSIWIDMAYANYKPKAIPGLSITGGKMKNPFAMNELFMDSDINPEGFWAQYNVPGLGAVEPFVGAGYFILRESSSDEDATMYAVQGGAKWKVAKDVAITGTGYWHDYNNWDSVGLSGSSRRGNDSVDLVPGFGIVGLKGELELKVAGMPLKGFAEWAHNCREADQTSDYKDENNAFATGVTLGQNKKKGDWSVGYIYGYVEANALPGYFVDSDFGFANRQGHVVRGAYNIMDNLTIGVNVLFTEPIFSPTTNSGSSAYEDRSTTIQADLIWKF